MKMNEAKEVLEANGIKFDERQTMKGSCLVDALSIGEGNIKPTIYEKTIENMNSKEELMTMVDRILSGVPDVKVEMIKDTEYLKNHVISCIRHETDDNNTLKWSVYGDLEEYIRIQLGDDGRGNSMSCIVTKSLMDQIDMDADELRMYARRNLKNHAQIRSMKDVLNELMGMDMISDDMEDIFYVASVDTMHHGASVMLLDDLLSDFCKEHGLSGVTIISSSINEVLLIAPDVDEDMVNNMIQDVNFSEVDEWEQLSSHCYHWYMPVAA